MLWFVDITHLRPGIINETLEQLVAAKMSDGEKIIFLATEGQERPSLDRDMEVITFPVDVVLNDGKFSIEVIENLNKFAANDSYICVATSHAPVKNAAQMFAVTSGAEVATLSLAPFVSRSHEGMTEWDDSFIPREEALRALARALVRGPFGVPMTNVRQMLTQEDSRFEKRIGSASSQPRLISALLIMAESEGLVRRATGPSKNNPLIELVNDPRIELFRETRRTRTRHRHISRQAAPTPSINTRSGDKYEEVQIQERKSDLFITTLRNDGFGPFQEVRLAAYEIMGGLVATSQPTVQILLRETVADLVSKSSELIKSKKPLPSSAFRSFLSRLLSRSPVLLHDGSPITYTWSDVDVVVTGLIENWQLALDGELVCRLLELGIEVDLEDTMDLAGALYNSRRNEYFDRVLEVERYLIATGRVREHARIRSRLELVRPVTDNAMNPDR